MTELHILLRALARAVRDLRPQDLTEARAAALFFTVAHDARCPRCAAVATCSTKEITCASCGARHSLTAGTPLHGTKLALRHWALAVFHVFIATETLNACAYSRTYALRRPTAWQLLHRVRDAIPPCAPSTRGAVAQLTGRENPDNTTHVAVALEDGALRCVLVEDAPPSPDAPDPRASLWLGHLRAWVVAHFRMISRQHVARYLRDFAARYARVTSPVLA